MTWVKICGITNLEHAKVAVDAGADALGFVFYEKSPRNVSLETAQAIAADLPSEVERVGVFAGSFPANLNEMILAARLTALQLHLKVGKDLASEPRSHAVPAGTDLYLAISAEHLLLHDSEAKSFIEKLERVVPAANPPARVFVDSGNARQPGGTGRVFDWHQSQSAIDRLKESFPVVLAGGLTPGNVAEAMGILKPWGVDVSSGVEAKPGKKDPDKVRAFIAAVRKADRGA